MRPSAARRLQEDSRSASPTPAPRAAPRGGGVSSGGLASSGIGVRQWRLGIHQVHHIVDPTSCLPSAHCWRTASTTAATLRPGERRVYGGNRARRARRGLARGWAPGPAGAGRRVGGVHVGMAGTRAGAADAGVERPDDGRPRGHGRARLDGPVVPDTGDRARLAHLALGHGGPRNHGVGGMDHRPVAALPFAVGAPEPVALLCRPDRHPHRPHDRRRLRAHRPGRRRDPLPFPLPTDLGGPRGIGLRHAAGRRDHQWAPPQDRGSRLAGRPLVRLRLLADRLGPRPRLGLRRPHSGGDAGVRGVHRFGRRRSGLAPGSRGGHGLWAGGSEGR